MKNTGEKCSLDKAIKKAQEEYTKLVSKIKALEAKIQDLISRRYKK